MSANSFPSVNEITQLQIERVAKWHQEPIDNPYEGIGKLICEQHEYNYRLWHKEDLARSPRATSKEIAEVKRDTDRLNQSRNDLIERIDDAITAALATAEVRPKPDARINTETPGSVIDRLSIMSLRIYHYREQLQRSDTSPEQQTQVSTSLELCHQQHGDLSLSLEQLLDDLFSGVKQHKTYRQLKMYNDPQLNPAIYLADEEC